MTAGCRGRSRLAWPTVPGDEPASHAAAQAGRFREPRRNSGGSLRQDHGAFSDRDMAVRTLRHRPACPTPDHAGQVGDRFHRRKTIPGHSGNRAGVAQETACLTLVARPPPHRRLLEFVFKLRVTGVLNDVIDGPHVDHSTCQHSSMGIDKRDSQNFYICSYTSGRPRAIAGVGGSPWRQAGPGGLPLLIWASMTADVRTAPPCSISRLSPRTQTPAPRRNTPMELRVPARSRRDQVPPSDPTDSPGHRSIIKM